MSTEDVGLVCRSCKHFNRAFVIHAPFTMQDIHQAAKNRETPTDCEECGASLEQSNLEPASERERERVAALWIGPDGRPTNMAAMDGPDWP